MAAYAASASCCSPFMLVCPCLTRRSTSACHSRPAFPVETFHPRDSVDNGRAGVPPILFAPSSVSGPVALVMATARGVAPLGAITAAGADSLCEPAPPALLPVRHSPSRRRHRRRWWSLTPPFHPSPTGCSREAVTRGQVRSLLQLSSGSPLPGLTVSSSDLARNGLGVGRFLWDRCPSDGSLARP